LEASSSGIPPHEVDSICCQADQEPRIKKRGSFPQHAEKIIGSSDSLVVRNLSLPFTEVTSLGASSYGIPPQETGISNNCVEWETAVLAYHHRELAVRAHQQTKVMYIT
jgi:hypothetical protein